MELWIRSQDKETLIKTSIVEIENFGENFFVSIKTRFDGVNASLGSYKTYDRALEVLDEIQGTIKRQEFVKLTFSKIPTKQYDNNEEKIDNMFSYFVYEMPEE